MRRMLAVRAAFLAVPLGLLSCSSEREICDHGAGGICRGIRFELSLRDGTTKRLCCPRCASDVVAQAGGIASAARMTALDYVTGAPVDAREAAYVDGSDVAHCNSPGGRQADTQPPDGCSPTLLAFATPQAAQVFVREHGGAVKGFDDLHFGSLAKVSR